MFVEFFQTLRRHGLKTSITEWLDLLAAMKANLAFADVDQFYHLSRLILVKDESYYDKFDRAFSEYVEKVAKTDVAEKIPNDWLENALKRELSEEEKQKVQQLGSLEELIKTFHERLKEQQKRHQGGSKWIGTGGTSPFGAYGYHPGGIRIGQDGNRNRSASKVWDKREFKDLDKSARLEQRGFQVALRKLRQFARTGAASELDLDETIAATSRKGGLLDLKWRAERHNAVKIILLLDVGGSMDDYIYQCEQLFTALKSEFKHLELFYFHNCVYEGVWRANSRRREEQIPTQQLIQTYGEDYKLLFVGDATMGPYEIAYPGGSVEHWNEEPGQAWLERLTRHFDKVAWLNPQPKQYWQYYMSVRMINDLMAGRMYPLTIEGLEEAMEKLR
ncbi:VWA domain-containing protein [Idiomarina sp.]|uniref:vWA domain-containing protein n=1 Tax=Idiomarina sp. TaxID=1874361 RepID=UPI001D5DF500|nr:VWA domain-containing protein [Idiomarina sp.]MCH2455490.1 VWA domain-containing protein [Idiomarina sp.]MCJ8315985.1 VWA domain-containing protein [Idiomarina sp.]NQZ15898.1 VWA domain-containing protein [Idiomarina sp.]